MPSAAPDWISPMAHPPDGRDDLRQASDRYAEQIGRAPGPIPGSQIHQAGPRAVVTSVTQAPARRSRKSGVAGAEAEPPLAPGRSRASSSNGPEAIAVWSRKIGIERQAGAGERGLLVARSLQLVDAVLGAGILPDDGVVDRLFGLIPRRPPSAP